MEIRLGELTVSSDGRNETLQAVSRLRGDEGLEVQSVDASDGRRRLQLVARNRNGIERGRYSSHAVFLVRNTE